MLVDPEPVLAAEPADAASVLSGTMPTPTTTMSAGYSFEPEITLRTCRSPSNRSTDALQITRTPSRACRST